MWFRAVFLSAKPEVDAPRRAPKVLVLREIAPEGLLTAWNRAHPGNEVAPYDRIYAVNGKTRIEEMQQELRKSQAVALRFVRYPQMFAVEPGAQRL